MIDHELDDYVANYESFTLADAFEQRLRMLVQQSLVTRLPILSPSEIWDAIQSETMPRQSYRTVVAPNRYRYADYRRLSNLASANRASARLLRKASPRVFGAAELDERIREIEEWVAQIRERGGRVIFIRLPTSLQVRKTEQRWFPRAEWWDVFAKRIPALTIHYEDHPQLAGFRPADGSHLGKAKAVLFSRRLGAILVRLSVAPGPD